MLKKLIQPFLKNEKCFILAYDHGSNKNPEIFKYQSANPTYIFELAKSINATGIVLNKGIAEIYSQTSYKTPLIIKLDTKSENTNIPTLICSVEYAKKLGAKAIGYTIYFGSEYEAEQIKVFSELVEQAHSLNMAAILWAYVVLPSWKVDNDVENLLFAFRQSYELGADLVKIHNPNGSVNISELHALIPNLPISMRGGEPTDNKDLLIWIKESLAKGIDGFIIGRNLWQKENATEIGKQIYKIVFEKNI